MTISPPERQLGERSADADLQRGWLTSLVEQLPLALVVAEAPSGRILMWNEAMVRLLDGRTLPPQDGPLVRAARDGEFVKGELLELLHDDGSRTVVEVSASPVRGEDGSILAAVAAFRDVRRRERTEAAEREFVANASHELQTPVTAIMSAVEALQAGAKDDPEQRDRFLSHLQREADRLGRLSSGLLVLARAERGGEQPRLEVLALQPLLAEVAERVVPISGVDVTVECAPDVGVLTHRDLLLQVLDNLGSNAAHHTRRGTIAFAARPVGEMRVVVEVSDTGRGIPVEHQEHVFRRFYRADADGPGSGLGLAIAAQATQVLGGRLELASTPGQGTILTLSLPGARLIS